jgi:hypothetical protein
MGFGDIRNDRMGLGRTAIAAANERTNWSNWVIAPEATGVKATGVKTMKSAL